MCWVLGRVQAEAKRKKGEGKEVFQAAPVSSLCPILVCVFIMSGATHTGRFILDRWRVIIAELTTPSPPPRLPIARTRPALSNGK